MKRWLCCLFTICAASLPVRAHVLDQYLQVAQIALAPDGVRIELRLIPGVEVAECIRTLIDVDGNGQITTAEEQAYARRVLQDIELAINGISAPLTFSDLKFPTQPEMRAGLGTIRLTFVAATTLQAADHQQLLFRNNHLPALGVYLVNALVPTANEIKISGQERDPLQRELRLRFHIISASTRDALRWQGVLGLCLCLLLLFPQWKYLRQYLQRGSDEQIKKSFP